MTTSEQQRARSWLAKARSLAASGWPAGALLCALWAAAQACSKSDFRVAENEPDSGPGGTSAGAAGTGGLGGLGGSEGGTAGSAGDAAGGTAGDDGSAGAPTCPASCASGEYCNVASGKCTSCKDVSRFTFATPEPITPRGDSAAGLRFPRITNKAGEMLFRVGNEDGAPSLFVTADFRSAGQELPFPVEINVLGSAVSGPFDLAGGSDKGSLFFDRTRSGLGSPRDLYSATRTTGIQVSAVQALPQPFNGPTDGSSSNYSIAVAKQTGRAFWMSTRSGAPDLFTALWKDGASAVVSSLSLRLGSSECTRAGADSTPWTTADGRFLLFSSLEVDPACQATGSARNLYMAVVSDVGQPALSIALDDLNVVGRDEADPSLSPDMCAIYFAANGTGAPDGFRLYRAVRH